MKRNIALLPLLLLMLLLSCARLEYSEKQQGYRHIKRPFIRVRIYQGENAVLVGGRGSFILRSWNEDGEKSAYFSASPLKVKARDGLLYLYDQDDYLLESRLRKVVLIPRKKKKWLWLNQKDFRGIFEFFVESGNSFYAVNVLNVEDYLKGVLPPEIGKWSKKEFAALKAQAVAARTYALTMDNRYPEREYDLINDIRDQVYTGIGGETRITNRAVEKTRGEALVYMGKLIEAYYHSTCGGLTDNVEDVWNFDPIPYLRSVNDNDFCRWSKFHDWNELYPASELLSHIRHYLKEKDRSTATLGDTVKAIKVINRTTGGRVRSLEVVTERGAITLYKDQIRWAFGRHNRAGIMPSSNIQIDLQRDSQGIVTHVHVSGYGYGHGIGMCQCGAIGRARFGFDYRQILKYYYTGARIEKFY